MSCVGEESILNSLYKTRIHRPPNTLICLVLRTQDRLEVELYTSTLSEACDERY